MGIYADVIKEEYSDELNTAPPVLPETDVTFEQESTLERAPAEIVKNQIDAENQLQLGLSMAQTEDVNPDEHAEAYELAQKVGLPPDTVRRDLPNQRKVAERNKVDYGKLVRDNPGTAKTLQDHDVAKAAQDDVPTLTNLENTMMRSLVAIGGGFLRGKHMTEEGVLAAKEGFDEKLEKEQKERLEELGTMWKENEYDGLMYGVNAASEIVGQMTASFYEAARKTVTQTDTYRYARSLVDDDFEYLEPFDEWMDKTTQWNDPLTNYGKTIFEVEAGHFYNEMKDLRSADGKPLDKELIQGGMTAVGSINTALEVVGLGFIAKPIGEGLRKLGRKVVADQVKKEVLKNMSRTAAAKGFAKAYATAWAGETVTEILQENVNMGVANVIKDMDEGEFKPISFDEWVETNKEIAKKVGSGMAFLAIPGAAMNLSVDLQKIQEAEDTQAMMDAVGDDVAQSKLRERMPKKFDEFMKTVSDGKDVYIPADRFDEYFQSAGLDPDEVLGELSPETQKEAKEAREREGDMRIPMNEYASKLAATEHHEQLKMDVKFNTEQLTPREAAELKESLPELLSSYIEMEQNNLERTTEEQAYHDEIEAKISKMIVGANETNQVAQTVAKIYPKLVGIAAKRHGLDPIKEFEKMGIVIQAPLSGRAAQPDAFDSLISDVRKNKAPSQRELYGKSVVEMLAEKGGVIDEGGELSARDAQLWHYRRGTRKFVNENGMSLDGARELAVQEGYLQEDATVDDLLEALDSEITNKEPVFAEVNVNRNAVAAMEEREILLDFLGQKGIDIATATNAEIKAVLQGGSKATTTGQVFNQEDLTDIYKAAEGKEVTIEALEEETGEVVQIQQDASEALQEVDNSIEQLRELIDCVNG